MIFDKIFEFILLIPNFMLTLLPALDVSLPDDWIDGFNNFLNGVGYFLPMPGLWLLICFNFAVDNFRIAWTLLLRIKSFIPGMGG